MNEDADVLAAKYVAITALITLDVDCAIALEAENLERQSNAISVLIQDAFGETGISEKESIHIRFFERMPLSFQMLIQKNLMRVPNLYYWALKKSGIRHHAF